MYIFVLFFFTFVLVFFFYICVCMIFFSALYNILNVVCKLVAAEGEEGGGQQEGGFDESIPITRITFKVIQPWNFDASRVLAHARMEESINKETHMNVLDFWKQVKYLFEVCYIKIGGLPVRGSDENMYRRVQRDAKGLQRECLTMQPLEKQGADNTARECVDLCWPQEN